MTRSARVPAFAKLNLGLRVLYRRPDGFHELRTVFQTISLADSLTIHYAPARSTEVTVAGTPHIPDNIAARAAHSVLAALKLTARVTIKLRKRIPSGAGLGGGSSDAAAVLLALPALARRPLDPNLRASLAAQLGSDVPFFLHGGRALGFGRGEELYPLPETGPARGLLVAPPIHSSTADAYRDLSLRLADTPFTTKTAAFQHGVWNAETLPDTNDFEPVVAVRHPRIAAIRDHLLRLRARSAAMTGSGSAVFGIFETPAQIRRARSAFPDDQTFSFTFISRSQYRARWRLSLGADPWAINRRRR